MIRSIVEEKRFGYLTGALLLSVLIGNQIYTFDFLYEKYYNIIILF